VFERASAAECAAGYSVEWSAIAFTRSATCNVRCTSAGGGCPRRRLHRLTITQPTSGIRVRSSKAVGLHPANSSRKPGGRQSARGRHSPRSRGFSKPDVGSKIPTPPRMDSGGSKQTYGRRQCPKAPIVREPRGERVKSTSLPPDRCMEVSDAPEALRSEWYPFVYHGTTMPYGAPMAVYQPPTSRLWRSSIASEVLIGVRLLTDADFQPPVSPFSSNCSPGLSMVQ
jgi:hypothetical protein